MTLLDLVLLVVLFSALLAGLGRDGVGEALVGVGHGSGAVLLLAGLVLDGVGHRLLRLDRQGPGQEQGRSGEDGRMDGRADLETDSRLHGCLPGVLTR